MSNAAGGLSDALRQLSDGVQELPIDQNDQEYHAEPEPARMSRTAPKSAGSSSRVSQAVSARAASSSSKPASAGIASRQNSAAKVANTHNLKLKQMAVPVLIGTGVLLLLPAIWSVLIRMDMEIIGWNKPGAKTMALAMLAAWPLALFMFAGAGFFYWQTHRIKDQMRQATKKSRQ